MLFLTASTFSSTGGIQKVCRAMSYTLSCIAKNDPKVSFKMYTLNDKIADTRYVKPTEFKGFNGNKLLFFLKAITVGIKSNTILLSHINLLSIGYFIKTFNKKSKIILIVHGAETWCEIASWKKGFINKHAVIWAVSNFTKEQLKNVHKINPDQIIVLNNCIDPFFKVPSEFAKPIELLNRYKITNQQPVILSIARLTKFDKAKGYDQVISIIPKLLVEFPKLRYLICGQYDEEEKSRIEQLINKHHLKENINLINFIPNEELEAHYMLADVFVLPSKKEGFGLVFIEAAACGCKVISGNTDGSTDAMLNGKLGIIVDPDCSIKIKEAVAKQLRKSFNPQEAKEIQKICINNFNHFDYTEKVKKILSQHE